MTALMLRLTGLILPLDHSDEELRPAILAKLELPSDALRDFHIARRGHDARKSGRIMLVYTLDLDIADVSVRARLLEREDVRPTPDTSYKAPQAIPAAHRPIVIGAGPCGLFAALVLAEAGLNPIILERGKAVKERTKDTWDLWRRSVLHPESNVQFGEGGAGTFSDGKLYSGVRDPRHLGRKVMEEFVAAGGPPEILTISKPHIGTFRLVTILLSMREKIEKLGGEYRFQSKVTDLLLEPSVEGQRLRGVILDDGTEFRSDHVVLAVGHSARDTMAMLERRGVALEAKPFSIGVRIEHPQSLIDQVRFGAQAGHEKLGAADYKLVHHAMRSTYSFCMCPGGTVVAAASEPGRLVTNGMSQYSRAERNANAGIVVEFSPEDCQPYLPGNVLAGIEVQRHWEEKAFKAGGSDYFAPAQRVEDFLAGRPSTHIGSIEPSYRPGVRPADFRDCLPPSVLAGIREALPAFDKTIPGFAMPDALMTAIETRTSSPVRVPRSRGGQSLNTAGLFPAGEGAGYAGGILSAGIDGIGAAEAVIAAINRPSGEL